MEQPLLQQNIAALLGITELPLEEQAAFLSEVGDVIFQTSLVRLVSVLSPERQQALESYLDTEPEPETLLGHLLLHYGEFKDILEEVVAGFKEDAQAALSSREDDITIIDA
jgi:hypothetical protein